MRLLPLLFALFLGLAAQAPATAFELPGLSQDAASYAQGLQRRSPAGGTPAQRSQAEVRASQAEQRGDWAAAVTAWEARIAAGDPTAENWLSLARAQLNRTPPEPRLAMQAAWNNFNLVDAGAAEVPSLALIAEALRRMDRMPEAIAAQEAVVERAPRDARQRQLLAELRRAAGLLPTRVTTDAEAEAARACIAFTLPPARRNDWRPADWVRSEPPIADLVVTKEGTRLCIAGLPYGRSTRLVLRAGLPGEDGVNMRADTPLTIAMPDRAPRIAFDSSRFILPRGQAPRVTIATVNVPEVSIKLLRITERGLVPLRRTFTLGDTLSPWDGDTISEEWGRLVWEGKASFPNNRANVMQRNALPMPDALKTAGPGLFALVVSPADPSRSARQATAILPIMATDLGVIAWRGQDGLAVQMRGLGDAQAKAGVKVSLLARNNEILGEAESNDLGLVRFPAPLMRGEGPLAPVAIHASLGDDLATLDLEAASFDLTDRGAEGTAQPGPLDAFLWTDRGIYRPGETIQAAALLRDHAGNPADFPARLRLKRPNGQVAAEIVPPRGAGNAVMAPFAISPSAPAGLWAIEAYSDPAAPPVGRVEIRVEAFVPEKLAVEFGTLPPFVTRSVQSDIPLNTRFLYGAPAAGLTGSAELRVLVAPEPFKPAGGGASPWAGWRFGVQGEQFAPDIVTLDVAETDAQGNVTLPVRIGSMPDSTRPLDLEMSVAMNEPGGRASRATATVPLRTGVPMVAIKPGFDGGAISPGQEAAFDIASVASDGQAASARLKLRLVRERPNWRLVTRGSGASYETVWLDEPVDSTELATTPAKPAHYAKALPFGRYRLEATDGGLGIAMMRFRSGWVATESVEVPDKVDVAADKPGYAPGDVAVLRIVSPFAGRASVAVLTDRLVALREIDVPEGGTEVRVPVEASWGPGAHVAVTVFRPGEVKDGNPARALGLTWLGLDPASRRLEVAIEAPDLLRPRQKVTIPVRLANANGGAMLTLAAVDEGVLRLTRFPTPDPVAHFLARRRLGTDIRDDYGRLIPPAEGEVALLRQGGDEGMDAAAIDIPQKVVALFSGPVAVGPDGRAQVTLDLPDFAGTLRLMAVAWEGNRIGSAAKPLVVRDPVVAEAVIPRFLSPGDEARLPVSLHNLDLGPGEVVATLTAEGAIELTGPARLAATLATGARSLPTSLLRAKGPGEGVLRLTVTAPDGSAGGFTATREARIQVRSSRPEVTETVGTSLAPGAEAALTLATGSFMSGAWRATASWGAVVRYDPAAMMRALVDYPFGCTEQTSSLALALAMSSDALVGPDRAARLQKAVERILDRQRFDGAFGLWSAQGNAEPWVTPYAIDVLLRAKAAGATVPQPALDAAMRAVADAVEDGSGDSPADRAAQAYRLYVLALSGEPMPGATRRAFQALDSLPTPLARAQIGAALAKMGDKDRAEAAFTAALAAPARRYWHEDYGSSERDSLAVALLMKESGILPARLTTLLGTLPGADWKAQSLGTQELGWAVATASVLGRDGRPAQVSLNGAALPPAPVVSAPLAGPGRVRNTGQAALFQGVSVTGLPAQPLPAGRQGMRIARRFFTADGQPLNLDTLKQNQTFLLQVEARSETGETHHAMIQQGLPAGWEIVGRLPEGDVPGLDFLGTLSAATAQPALDDRLAIAADLTPSEPVVRFAVRMRVVTGGNFELPGAEVQDMYRPGIFARQNTGRINVAPAD